MQYAAIADTIAFSDNEEPDTTEIMNTSEGITSVTNTVPDMKGFESGMGSACLQYAYAFLGGTAPVTSSYHKDAPITADMFMNIIPDSQHHIYIIDDVENQIGCWSGMETEILTRAMYDIVNTRRACALIIKRS